MLLVMTFDEIKSLLKSISDPVQRLEAVMDIGKTLPPIPAGCRGVEIKGCASKVEIYPAPDGKLYANADSAMVRGIVAILLSIKRAGLAFSEFPALGLDLGAQRLHGGAAVIEYLESL